MKSKALTALGIFLSLVMYANFAGATEWCRTDHNSAGIPYSCSSTDGSGWTVEDCDVTCHVGKAVCRQARWIKNPPGCGEVIQPLCFCSGN